MVVLLNHFTCTSTCTYRRSTAVLLLTFFLTHTVHSEYKYIQVPTVEDLSVAPSVEYDNETASISVTEVIIKHTVHNLKIDLHEEGREEGGREGGRERKRERVLC